MTSLIHRMAGLSLRNLKCCKVNISLMDLSSQSCYITERRALSSLCASRDRVQMPSSMSTPNSQAHCMSIIAHNLKFNKFSTSAIANEINAETIGNNDVETLQGPSAAYALLPKTFGRKSIIELKPRIVKKRLSKLKTYNANEKGIRHSPWRLNLVCQFAAGLPVKDALMQLQFCQKMKAPLVATLIERTARRADIKDGLKLSQLEVAECFATHGSHLKRIKIMGRGRSGIKRRRHSHIRLVLREIDFDLKILQAKSMNERKEWFVKKLASEEDKKIAEAEREELLALEKTVKEKKENDEKND